MSGHQVQEGRGGGLQNGRGEGQVIFYSNNLKRGWGVQSSSHAERRGGGGTNSFEVISNILNYSITVWGGGGGEKFSTLENGGWVTKSVTLS